MKLVKSTKGSWSNIFQIVLKFEDYRPYVYKTQATHIVRIIQVDRWCCRHKSKQVKGFVSQVSHQLSSFTSQSLGFGGIYGIGRKICNLSQFVQQEGVETSANTNACVDASQHGGVCQKRTRFFVILARNKLACKSILSVGSLNSH